MQVNKVIIVGNLGREPEARYMPAIKEVERIVESVGKSRTPKNIEAAATDAGDVADGGATGGDGGGPEGGASGDDDGGDDGDPDSDRRPLSIPPIDCSDSSPSLQLARVRRTSGAKPPKQSRSPKPPSREERIRRAHWMAFLLTLAAIGVAAWFAEKGYSPTAASAFAAALSTCIVAILRS